MINKTSVVTKQYLERILLALMLNTCFHIGNANTH